MILLYAGKHDQLLCSIEGAVIHRNWSLNFHSSGHGAPHLFNPRTDHVSCSEVQTPWVPVDNWNAVIFFFFFNMFLASNMELACHNFSDKMLDFIFLYVASYIFFPSVLSYPFFVAAELVSRSLWCFIGCWSIGTDRKFVTYVDQIEYVYVCNIELVLPKLLNIVARRLRGKALLSWVTHLPNVQ